MAKLQVIVHGGVGNSIANQDGCEVAARLGLEKLQAGEDALAAALAAAVALEDDERFNAGTGSSLRMDGQTIEMDAAIMDTNGRLGAVAGIQRVKNPVLVAREVADTPHWLLCGQGATRFARLSGFDEYYYVSPHARAHYNEVMKILFENGKFDFEQAWQEFDYKRYWNFEHRWEDVLVAYGTSTIGAIAQDAAGHFAVCTSTGGASPMLFGRIGDTPIVGSGYYCGPAGAIAATGIGEYIVKHMLCRTVYEWLANGMPLQDALQQGIALMPERVEVGLIGLTPDGAAQAASRQMPTAHMAQLASETALRRDPV